MGGPEIENLIALLARLPGLGPRSARRAALKLLQQPDSAHAAAGHRACRGGARACKSCSLCGNLDSRDPCTICTDPQRDRRLICVVEGVGDLWALERATVHRGAVPCAGRHALGAGRAWAGGPEHRPAAGADRAKAAWTEVILALRRHGGRRHDRALADRAAEAASASRVTRLAQGVPIGGALEVLDDGTLAAACAPAGHHERELPRFHGEGRRLDRGCRAVTSRRRTSDH